MEMIYAFLCILAYFLPAESTTTETTKNLCGTAERSKSFLNAVADIINSAKCKNPHSSFDQRSKCNIKPMDCAELLQCGNTKSGVYTVWPRNKIIQGSVEVYCDMSTDQGGWTVIQRRGNYGRPIDYFFKEWAEYKNGFGDIVRDFWLGNDLIFALTNQGQYSMRVDLQDVENSTRYAHYDTFWIDSEDEQYKLHITDYSGDAGDSLKAHHNKKFSTKDKDNDNSETSCAQIYKGAWWYSRCYDSNLNGVYLRGKYDRPNNDGVTWHAWKGVKESMDTTEIKIRPKNFYKSSLEETHN